VDAVWLMGVWERSPAGLALAAGNAELQASFRSALPDLRPQDVVGSPYCVRGYVVDAAFGGPAALAAARAALAARGARLLLDYVPNHVAPDHPWVRGNPELFVRGDEHDIDADPAGWLAAAGQVLAHGRDPYFPPWPDVVQLNAFAAAMRAETARTLADIASQCDGIRCDMAMLMINRIFARTWGSRAGPEPAEEFWPAVIGQLRTQHPETVLVAEAYWDLEWELQQQGFDFCYDKRLYDRIVAGHRVRAGAWRLLEVGGWPDNQSCRNLVAWSWSGDRGSDRHVVVVNLSAEPAQGRIPLDWTDLRGRTWCLTDLLQGSMFNSDGGELADPGLFVALESGQFHLLALR
jgi:hypothetical protein